MVELDFKGTIQVGTDHSGILEGKNLFSKILAKFFGRFLKFNVIMIPNPPMHPNCKCREDI